MTLSTLLNLWRTNPNIVAWRTFPARPAQTAPFPVDLHPALVETLQAQGIDALYTHQATTWQHLQAGRHPVIVTGTASGKTLCYNLPVLNHLLMDSEARALYLFPTKALAHDQAEALRRFVSALQNGPAGDKPGTTSGAQAAISTSPSPISPAVYDGDTPTHTRPLIRQNARLVLTNPDMLHTGILPHHTRWAGLFRQLRFVVIDELHIYRGVFGSHVANVIRRLKRVARFYNAAPQFILTSATIANPVELAGRLIEEPVVRVDNDGAVKGTRHFLIYNPPLIDRDLGLRRSALQESVRLTKDLLEHNLQTIVFGRARRTVELILRYLRAELDSPDANLAEGEEPAGGQIRAYRSGYLPRQRREIEQGLRQGQVRAVIATNALELGIDIGGLEAAVLAGYPGAIAATWQQAGRAGRGRHSSLVVLIASAGLLDQFLARHPDYFFERSPEQALINPDNLLILLQHVRCAAFELPFQRGENLGSVAGEHLLEFLEFLRAAGELHQSGDKYFWMADHYPAQAVSLRSASPDRVLLQAGEAEHWQTIGEVDRASAPWLVHPQAIYLHEGQTYRVEALDLEQNIARLHPADPDYYTEPKLETTVQLIEVLNRAETQGATRAYGEIMVTTQLVGYHQLRWFTHERLASAEILLPPAELTTTGYWLALLSQTVDHLRDQGLWRSDPNDYGPDWPKLRRQVRARDGYRCQMCGAPEKERAHDVHHKIPFRAFGSAQAANHLANLMTLCRPCHRRAELAVRIRSGLAGLAFVLRQLAPLFLMCDAHDIAVHADPKSPLAEGRPAVIIYDLAPGGIGFSERLFVFHDRLIAQAYDLVVACECADGCPSCVGPAAEQGQGGKRETRAILEALI